MENPKKNLCSGVLNAQTDNEKQNAPAKNHQQLDLEISSEKYNLLDENSQLMYRPIYKYQHQCGESYLAFVLLLNDEEKTKEAQRKTEKLFPFEYNKLSEQEQTKYAIEESPFGDLYIKSSA